jgi:hypothetical protein
MNQTSSSIVSKSSSDWAIVASISEILLAAVTYLVQFTDNCMDVRFNENDHYHEQEDEHHQQSLQFSPDAIQHLHKSLTEVHVVAIQYLEWVESTNRVHGTIDFIDRCVIRVFTTLTSDTITFPLSNSDEKELANCISHNIAEATTMQQLDALFIVIKLIGSSESNSSYQNDFETLKMVLLCLLNVLTLAHGSNEHGSMIIASNVIGEVLVPFLVAIVRCDDSTNSLGASDAIRWLADVIELAAQLHDGKRTTMPYKRQYQAIIVTCIQQKIDAYATANDSVRRDFAVLSMKTLIDCYITLQGSGTPNATDSVVVQQALTLVA